VVSGFLALRLSDPLAHFLCECLCVSVCAYASVCARGCRLCAMCARISKCRFYLHALVQAQKAMLCACNEPCCLLVHANNTRRGLCIPNRHAARIMRDWLDLRMAD